MWKCSNATGRTPMKDMKWNRIDPRWDRVYHRSYYRDVMKELKRYFRLKRRRLRREQAEFRRWHDFNHQRLLRDIRSHFELKRLNRETADAINNQRLRRTENRARRNYAAVLHELRNF